MSSRTKRVKQRPHMRHLFRRTQGVIWLTREVHGWTVRTPDKGEVWRSTRGYAERYALTWMANHPQYDITALMVRDLTQDMDKG